MLKKRLINFSIRGISLLEVTLSLGLLAGVGFFLSQTILQSQKGQKRISANLDFTTKMWEVFNVLQSPRYCNLSTNVVFKEKTAAGAITIAKLSSENTPTVNTVTWIGYSSGSQEIKVIAEGDVIGNNLTVSEITFERTKDVSNNPVAALNNTPSVGKTTHDLNLIINANPSSGTGFPVSKIFKVNLITNSHAPDQHTIVGCQSSSGLSMETNIQTFTNPGNYNFTVPSEVTVLKVEAWGGGAGGTGASPGIANNQFEAAYKSGGAGGGGGYVLCIVPVSSGETIPFRVGAGGTGCGCGTNCAQNGQDSFFKDLNSCRATGGMSLLSGGVGGGGGTGAGTFAKIKLTGGSGEDDGEGYAKGGAAPRGGDGGAVARTANPMSNVMTYLNGIAPGGGGAAMGLNTANVTTFPSDFCATLAGGGAGAPGAVHISYDSP